MEFKPVNVYSWDRIITPCRCAFTSIVCQQISDTATAKLTSPSNILTTTERLLTHFQKRKVTLTATKTHTCTHTKRSIKYFSTALVEDPGSSKYQTWALCGVNVCVYACVCVCPADHEILCYLYLMPSHSPSYLLIYLAGFTFCSKHKLGSHRSNNLHGKGRFLHWGGFQWKPGVLLLFSASGHRGETVWQQ